MLIEVRLKRVMISETWDHQVVVLEEKDGDRNFPIVIGIYEASAIDRGIKEIKLPRPLTHDLLASVISAMKGRLVKVIINDLIDSTFYARLIIQQNGSTIEVDSRPSDALALAVKQDTPIFVEERVLDEVCMRE